MVLVVFKVSDSQKNKRKNAKRKECAGDFSASIDFSHVFHARAASYFAVAK